VLLEFASERIIDHVQQINFRNSELFFEKQIMNWPPETSQLHNNFYFIESRFNESTERIECQNQIICDGFGESLNQSSEIKERITSLEGVIRNLPEQLIDMYGYYAMIHLTESRKECRDILFQTRFLLENLSDEIAKRMITSEVINSENSK
jgi:hypothetical protein